MINIFAEFIDPNALISFCISHDYREVETKTSYKRIFQFSSEAEMYQVTIPLDRSLFDYKEAISYACTCIVCAEGLSDEEMFVLSVMSEESVRNFLSLKEESFNRFYDPKFDVDLNLSELFDLVGTLEKIKYCMTIRNFTFEAAAASGLQAKIQRFLGETSSRLSRSCNENK